MGFVFLVVGLIGLFVLPAAMPTWRSFAIVWAGLAVLLGVLVFQHLSTGAETDALAQMFNRAFLHVAAGALLLAVLAQSARALALARDWHGYRHGVVIAAGVLLLLALLVLRLGG